ncbi:hypothetical protein [Streptomyces sp. S.PNR 29]|uniref:hypothetical protein n=1 Tax=Streptomyces sp. S.PNR 29 TaxID=2973805 RepID=UPI0025AF59A6|nr:hypothetical protein [Streptomyces sp. S.PNR 29]MDN0196854.1 hypothetical protein [Streptomyces sp. S.PNR 29]
MTHKWCPTCRAWHGFRKLNAEEKAAVRAAKGDRHYVDDLWRCSAEGCLWYQPYFHTRGGDVLPERFREEAAAPE